MSRIGQRLFAAVYDPFLGPSERRVYGPHREFVAGGAKGRVLEIGAGTGANLPYYPPGATLTLSDPNPHMLKRLVRKAGERGIDAETRDHGSEELPYADASFDTVVGTLVLCSVDDPARALSEIARVLTPGGRFRFMEHVRGHGRVREKFQDLMTPVWRTCFQGCHPNRNTSSALQDAGLEIVETRKFSSGPYPVRPHIVGVARRR